MSRSRVTSGLSKVLQSSRSTAPSLTSRCISSLRVHNPAPLVSAANIQARSFATKGDGEIAKFLAEEIASEKSNQKSMPRLDGWESKLEGAEVTLTKAGPGGEKLIVSLNVNHTVDSAEPDDGQGEAPEMLSRPNFEVDIVKPNGRTLSFTCSYLHPDEMSQDPEGQEDIFAIDEVTMFDGEKISDKNYAVAGDILDGYLYDLFMTMLDERGVTNDFVDKLADWCTAHEQAQYINLLQEVEKFTKM
eukprot:TRINITY_DN3711_c0_g1_i1.p1 TRINITY_DN3711_c0_g1~~TRINITY_DN3711_c0_g1_i1.p1  ORF type:complete len:259 (+),score=92.88 TRINITY_DN3711_c0_g1_i1:42-779(+)